jgi:pantothenate kinase type III
MNFIITVDAGNSKTKCALFNSKNECLKLFDLLNIEKVIKEFDLKKENTNAVVSNVTKTKIELTFSTLEISSLFEDGMFLDMKVNYNETLGIDRLAIAYHHYKSKPLPALLIDTGTFSTLDTVSSSGFEGGFILPGLGTIERTYLRGANLPEVKADYNDLLDTPHSTLEAISRGAWLTYIAPIEKVIDSNSSEVVVITGGNSKTLFQYLSKSSSSPLQVDENLIHKALFFIKNMVE